MIEINYSDIIERMKQAGKLKNDSAVARVLGVTPQALSNYKKRGRMPTNLIIRFASLYELSVDWLLTGKGGMHLGGRGAGEELGAYGVAGEELAAYAKGAGEELQKTLGSSPLNPDEIIYMGKLLKVLRRATPSTVTAIKCSIDAFLKAAGSTREGEKAN